MAVKCARQGKEQGYIVHSCTGRQAYVGSWPRILDKSTEVSREEGNLQYNTKEYFTIVLQWILKGATPFATSKGSNKRCDAK